MDEALEPLLYDPSRPSHAVMLDALPGRPTIDASGQLVSEGGAFTYIMPPLLGACLVVMFVVMTFLM
jgi:hypothetical protein